MVLGCSDSHVPAEIIFDQGTGNLFVIHVAGNIVGLSQVGSVEFAAGCFGTGLVVVVLGHFGCGAFSATLKELASPMEYRSPNLCSILDYICPAMQALLASEHRHHPDALLQHAVRSNIRVSVNH